MKTRKGSLKSIRNRSIRKNSGRKPRTSDNLFRKNCWILTEKSFLIKSENFKGL